MNPYIELIRPVNCIIAGIAVLIGYFLVTKQISLELFFTIISAILICGGGQAINDVYDSAIDKKINPKKPIPSKRVKRKNALYYSLALFVMGVLISTQINLLAFLVALGFSLLLIAYASLMYRIKYVGNVVVALGTAFTLIYGAIAGGEISAIVIFFAVSAFFANMAREVTKDFEDLKKDKGFKVTLPMVCGEKAKLSVFFYYFVSFLLALAIGIKFNLGLVYLFLVILSTLIFSLAVKELNLKNYSKSQSFSKKGMLLSLIAYISVIFVIF
jgi:geranylgeranylglycerol-phosphate geranylgeranyltransferase